MATTTTLTATATAQINYTYTKTDNTAGWATNEQQLVSQITSFTAGDGANKAESVYREAFSVTSGSPNKDFDLFGSLTDVFGDTINIEQLKVIFVKNSSTTAGDLLYVGPLGASNPLLAPFMDADGGVVVQPGGSFFLNAPREGFSITATAQTVRVQYQGSSATIAVEAVFIGSAGDLESSSSSSQSSLSISFSSSSSSSTSSISSQG